MDFDSYKASYLKENKKLKVALAITLIVTSLTTLSVFLQQKHYLYKGKAIFEERLLSVEVCRIGFESLAGNEPNSYVITDGILDIVNKSPFSLIIDKILKLESLEEKSCKIILKSEGKLLAFKINLEESIFYPFHYKIIQLDELAIKGEL